MDLGRTIERIDKLTQAELKHALSLVKVEIQNYARACRNYPEDRMQKYGIPYMRRLEGWKAQVEAKLGQTKP